MFIEKKLEMKQSSHSSKLHQRKMGPQNRKPPWDKMIPVKGVSCAFDRSRSLESHPVLKNAPVVFTTRNQSLVLDAVANGSGGLPFRGTSRVIHTVATATTTPELHQEPDTPGSETNVSFSVYHSSIESDIDESYQQLENSQKEKPKTTHGL